VCLYVCDQETPKREVKGPSWTVSACEWMNEYSHFIAQQRTIFSFLSFGTMFTNIQTNQTGFYVIDN
jgi:hypothetical protein